MMKLNDNFLPLADTMNCAQNTESFRGHVMTRTSRCQQNGAIMCPNTVGEINTT